MKNAKTYLPVPSADGTKVGAGHPDPDTPTFIVGKSVGEGVDGELVVGAMPFQMLDVKLRELSK
jgi:hypothetical protein